MTELLSGNILTDLPQEHQDNLTKLQVIINKVRILWGKPMTITSGYRSVEQHLKIYSDKGITDKNKIPMKSKHLIGAACDIADEGLVLTAWLKANPQIMEDCNIFCEAWNSNWSHIQFLPFGSYKPGQTRWFNP